MVTPKPRESERKMSEEKKKESEAGATAPKPELQTVRFEWPGLPVGPGSDIIFYKPDQRRQGELPPGVQPVPAIWLPSPQDGTWQYTVLTENNLAVKKFNYLAASNPSDTEDTSISQHIHEHHHYGHRYPIVPNQAKPVRYERHGYLFKVDNGGTVSAPPQTIPHHGAGMYRPHNNPRAVENNGAYYQHYGPQYNCPYYAEYQNAAYPQHQIFPYPEVNAIDQHYHIHQHYYHPHYQYQSAAKYQQSQFSHHAHQPRFVAHQQPRFHAHHHTTQFPYHHARPFFAYNEGFNWFSQGPFPRPSYVQNEYDLSALKENDQPATSSPQGLSGTKHIIACGGIIIIVLIVLSFLDRYRLLSRFRPKRAPVQNTLKIVCQIPDEYTAPTLPAKSDDSNGDEPPSYSEQNPAADLAAKQRLAKLIPPYSCIFTSGKNKVPRVLFFDPRKDKEVMEKMGLTKIQGDPTTTQKMNLNIPTHMDMHDSHTERANLLIQINDTETESGCIIGMDVLVKKDSEEALMLRDREGVPFSVTVEQLTCIDPKETKKSDTKAKK